MKNDVFCFFFAFQGTLGGEGWGGRLGVVVGGGGLWGLWGGVGVGGGCGWWGVVWGVSNCNYFWSAVVGRARLHRGEGAFPPEMAHCTGIGIFVTEVLCLKFY